MRYILSGSKVAFPSRVPDLRTLVTGLLNYEYLAGNDTYLLHTTSYSIMYKPTFDPQTDQLLDPYELTHLEAESLEISGEDLRAEAQATNPDASIDSTNFLEHVHNVFTEVIKKRITDRGDYGVDEWISRDDLFSNPTE